MFRERLVWVAIVVLLLVAVALGLRSSPQVALQYWYLLLAPMLLAAGRFGLRGGAVTSAAGMLILLTVFMVSGPAIAQATAFLQELIAAADSPEQVTELALRLADLRAVDASTAFGRVFTGMIIASIGAIMLGVAVDHRGRVTRRLERVYSELSRYCPPQIVEAVISHQGGGRPPVISVRKEITILFADLRGFTALAERLEPEEIAKLLNEFFTAMTDEVLREGGTLDKYIGDEVMALFGDPQWHPDHPERAIRAALAMQQRMRELHAQWIAEGRETIGLGIGVATGYATVGITGSSARMEYTALGSTVNIASRLGDLAQASQVLTTRKSFWRVRGTMAGVSRGPIHVKGFAQPIELVEILGPRIPGTGEIPVVGGRTGEIVTQVMNDPAYRGTLLTGQRESPTPGGPDLSEEEYQLARQVAVLAGYPLLQSVPAAETAMLIARSTLEEYPEGAVVVHQGEPQDKFYIILQGDVVILQGEGPLVAAGEPAWERHIASLARGDHFGEVALLFDTTRTATVRAGSPTRLLVMGQEDFYSVLSHAPALRAKIEATARARVAMPVSPRLRAGADVGTGWPAA